MNRDLLKEELDLEKQKLIEKYNLKCSEDLIWEYRHNKYHTVKYFSHKFAKKHSTLALVFYINRLCYGKIKYFEENIYKFKSYKYEFKTGFKRCETYDMEFLLHIPSRKIDIRDLKNIKNMDEFRVFCRELEALEVV